MMIALPNQEMQDFSLRRVPRLRTPHLYAGPPEPPARRSRLPQPIQHRATKGVVGAARVNGSLPGIAPLVNELKGCTVRVSRPTCTGCVYGTFRELSGVDN